MGTGACFVAQPDLELSVSCLSLPSAGIIAVYHQAWLLKSRHNKVMV
jgi:hypothetical protein